ncbi:MAG: DUF1624 domain-containing protein [Planctomycetes bacterium]|nr:DUF1624 domain-containing protein [Planctomycetota bacterium]
MEDEPRPQEPPAAPEPKAAARYAFVDVLRGMALVAMFAYHFAYDLNHFRVFRERFNHDPHWLTARTMILGSFLLLVGVSLVLATRRGIRWEGYLRRLAHIAACSLLVSLATYLMFPKSGVFFGVLHHIGVATVLGLAFLRLGWANLPLGLGLIGLGAFVEARAFDSPALQWIGLMTHKPITEDYVPLLPWFGVVVIGIFAGKRLLSVLESGEMRTWRPRWAPVRVLAFAGRHALVLYVVHQPLFMGVLSLVLKRG